ncbi:hypothetical protein F66182_15800, partial [Fusarium sp. NRRL 66182]
MSSGNLAISSLPNSIMWYLTLFVLGLSAVLVLPVLTGRRLSITHRKQGWRISLLNTRGDFTSNAEQLIQRGFYKSPSAFRMSTDGGPRLMLSQKHLDAMSDDDHFDVAEAVKRDYLLDLFGFETAFHGTLHSEIVAPAVTAMTKKLVPLVPLMSKEAALGLEKEWTDNSEYHDIPLQPTLGGVVARLASLAFVGPELCRNPSWLKITVSYTINRVIAVYVLRIFPSFLQPIVHWILPPCRKLRAQIQQARELVLPALEHERQQQST